MRYVLLLMLVLFATPAFAEAKAEARALALANSCKPKKLELLRQTFGRTPESLYEVTCDYKPAAGTNAAEKAAEPTIRISCRGKLCRLL